MHHFLRPGDVVYDVGAEEGDLTCLLASWGCNVVAIEPNPKAWPCIAATFAGNNLRPAAWWVGMLSDRSWRVDDEHRFGWDDWPDCASDPMVPDHGFFHLAEHAGVSPAITLDELVDRVGLSPNAIQVDCEGGEYHVLRGAIETLRYTRPLVFCSTHPEFMADLYGESDEEFYGFMQMAGYERVFLCRDHEVHDLFVPQERMWPR